MTTPNDITTHFFVMENAFKEFEVQYNKDNPEAYKSISYKDSLNEAWMKHIEDITILSNI